MPAMRCQRQHVALPQLNSRDTRTSLNQDSGAGTAAMQSAKRKKQLRTTLCSDELEYFCDDVRIAKIHPLQIRSFFLALRRFIGSLTHVGGASAPCQVNS